VKVLHVLETLSPRYGGPVRVVTELVREQQLAGLEVQVFTTEADHPRGVYHKAGWDTLAEGAVPVYYGGLSYEPLRISLDFARQVRRHIRSFDIVHIHGLYRFPPTYAAYEARRLGVPYIIRTHGSLDPYLYDKSSRSVVLKRLYERWFDFPNLNASSAIHYTAEDERERVEPLKLRAPSFVVPNGLDWGTYRTLPARGRLRARWSLGDAPLVLFLGRLHFKKGLDLLIPAFDMVRSRVPDARLVIAGPENDDYGATVRSWVRERELEETVLFAGELKGADVVQAYVDADVFALPSYTENFGMTVAEAMACGLPVVISDQVNIHEEVSRAGAGVVTRCDAGEVATALEDVLLEAGRRQLLGEAGRSLVRERFTWPAIVGSLTREYENAIGRHRRAGVKRLKHHHIAAETR
jgi:glycosyltransferase involved in cell wall biosynthesis